jgi:hypothetical protein
VTFSPEAVFCTAARGPGICGCCRPFTWTESALCVAARRPSTCCHCSCSQPAPIAAGRLVTLGTKSAFCNHLARCQLLLPALLAGTDSSRVEVDDPLHQISLLYRCQKARCLLPLLAHFACTASSPVVDEDILHQISFKHPSAMVPEGWMPAANAGSCCRPC